MSEPKEPEKKDDKKASPLLEQFFRQKCMGMVSLAREFEKEKGKERMLATAERMHIESSVSGLEERLEGIPHESLEDFITYHDSVMSANLGLGFQSGETMETGRTRFVFVVRECWWARFFREMGEEELGYALNCSSDFEYARCFNPKLKLTRTKTLMHGDDCCDFVYTWEE